MLSAGCWSEGSERALLGSRHTEQGDGQMRTVTLGMNVSLDGFVATEAGGLEWIFPNFSPELMADTQQLLEGFDTILMGRKNYEGQAASWSTAEGPLADVMNNVEKVV